MNREEDQWKAEREVLIQALEKRIDSRGVRLKSDRDDENGVSIWSGSKKILRPLRRIRGLGIAYVHGTVSSDWARYLEGCMMSGENDKIPRLNAGMYGMGTADDAADFRDLKTELLCNIMRAYEFSRIFANVYHHRIVLK